MPIDFGDFFGLISQIFAPGRKLKPAVKPKQIKMTDEVGKANLIVHIIRATDVPIRLSYY